VQDYNGNKYDAINFKTTFEAVVKSAEHTMK
jgi:hypothetical protein